MKVKIDENNCKLGGMTIPHHDYTPEGFVKALNDIPGQAGIWSWDAQRKMFHFTATDYCPHCGHKGTTAIKAGGKITVTCESCLRII